MRALPQADEHRGVGVWSGWVFQGRLPVPFKPGCLELVGKGGPWHDCRGRACSEAEGAHRPGMDFIYFLMRLKTPCRPGESVQNIADGVHGDAVETDLIVQMGAGGATGVAHVPDQFATADFLSAFHHEAVHMGI